MKTLLYFCVVALLASCSPSLTNVKDDCLDLAASTNGKVTFQLNDSPVGHEPYQYFPRHYLIVVFEDRARTKAIDAKILLRKTTIEQFVQLDPKNKDNYCIVVYKDQNLAGYKQMKWANVEAKQANLDKNQKVYYASTSKSPFLFIKTITSKDGAVGDGVRAVID